MSGAAASPAMKPVVNAAVSLVGTSASTTVDGEYQRLMSDMFHDLSQPLSTLTCLLEVNLLLSRPLRQVRHDLKIALYQVRSIVQIFRNFRELWEAGNMQQDQQIFSLTECLREVLAELLPVAESKRVKVSLTSGSECVVNFQPSRLRQALFHLLESAVGSCAEGAEVIITAGEENDGVRVTLAVSAVGDFGSKALDAGSTAESGERKQREFKRRLGLAIARRIFEIMDGSLHVEARGEQLWLEVRLPAVPLPN
jgi:two-component system sensor histidine kinase CiaH